MSCNFISHFTEQPSLVESHAEKKTSLKSTITDDDSKT